MNIAPFVSFPFDVGNRRDDDHRVRVDLFYDINQFRLFDPVDDDVWRISLFFRIGADRRNERRGPAKARVNDFGDFFPFFGQDGDAFVFVPRSVHDDINQLRSDEIRKKRKQRPLPRKHKSCNRENDDVDDDDHLADGKSCFLFEQNRQHFRTVQTAAEFDGDADADADQRAAINGRQQQFIRDGVELV